MPELTKSEIHRMFVKMQSKLSNDERRYAHKIIKLTMIELEKESKAQGVDEPS